jgi:hypothetical protein
VKRAVLALLLVGCTTPSLPYLTEYAVSPPRMPYSRPSSGTKVVRAYNPFPRPVSVDVWCPGNVFDGHSGVTIGVAGNDSTGFLVEEGSADLVRSESCVIRGWHFDGL